MSIESGRGARLLRESFVPVVLVILALFGLLLYVYFSAEFEASKITIIDVVSETQSRISESGDAGGAEEGGAMMAAEASGGQSAAAALMKQGKWAEAEQLYRDELARHPGSSSLNALGAMFLKKNDLARALEYLNRAINTEPVELSAYFNRALVYSRSGQPQEALADYRAVLKGNPNHFEAQYNMGLVQMRLSDYIGAEESLRSAARSAGGGA